jgi:hypothetical protein
MVSILDISRKNGMSKILVRQRLKTLGIEPTKKIINKGYYNNKVAALVKTNEHKFMSTPILKLKIVEYYLMFKHQPKKVTAAELGLSADYFCKIIVEWENNDNCITVKSKL